MVIMINNKLLSFYERIKETDIIPGILLYAVILSNAYIMTYSVFVSLASIILLLIYRRKDKSYWCKPLIYFAFLFPMIIIGFATSMIHNSALTQRDYLRDIFYLSQSASFYFSGILFGACFASNRIWFKRYLYLSSFVLLLCNTAIFVLGGSFKFDAIREAYLHGMETIAIAMFISTIDIVDRKKSKNRKDLLLAIGVLITCIFQFVISFSRTGIILVFAFYSIYIFGKKNKILIFSYLGVLVLIVGMFILSLNIEIPYLSIYAKKIYGSLSEISINHNWDNYKERTQNWRGYELEMALKMMLNSDVGTILFGKGYGAAVQLSYSQPIDNLTYINLPIIHNSYAGLLVKTGVVGILLVLAAYSAPYLLIINSKSDLDYSSLCISIFVYIVIAQCFVMGTFSSCEFGMPVMFYSLFLFVLDKEKQTKTTETIENTIGEVITNG